MNVSVWYKCVQVLVLVLIAVAFGSHGAPPSWKKKEPSGSAEIEMYIDPVQQSENEELESKRIVAKSVFNIPVRSPTNRCPPGHQKLPSGSCVEYVRGDGGQAAVSEGTQTELLKQFLRKKPSRNRHRPSRPTTTTIQDIVPTTEMTEVPKESTGGSWLEDSSTSSTTTTTVGKSTDHSESYNDLTTTTMETLLMEMDPVVAVEQTFDSFQEQDEDTKKGDDKPEGTTEFPFIFQPDSTVMPIEEGSATAAATEGATESPLGTVVQNDSSGISFQVPFNLNVNQDDDDEEEDDMIKPAGIDPGLMATLEKLVSRLQRVKEQMMMRQQFTVATDPDPTKEPHPTVTQIPAEDFKFYDELPEETTSAAMETTVVSAQIDETSTTKSINFDSPTNPSDEGESPQLNVPLGGISRIRFPQSYYWQQEQQGSSSDLQIQTEAPQLGAFNGEPSSVVINTPTMIQFPSDIYSATMPPPTLTPPQAPQQLMTPSPTEPSGMERIVKLSSSREEDDDISSGRSRSSSSNNNNNNSDFIYQLPFFLYTYPSLLKQRNGSQVNHHDLFHSPVTFSPHEAFS